MHFEILNFVSKSGLRFSKSGHRFSLDLEITLSFRRGKEAANVKWGVTPAVMAGNYIIAASSQLLASLRDDEATIVISKIIEDLIHGELCQMESIQSTHEERYKQVISAFKFSPRTYRNR